MIAQVSIFYVGSCTTVYHIGKIRETKCYATVLSAAQRKQIEPYPAIKYGFAPGQSSAQNYLNPGDTVIDYATAIITYKNKSASRKLNIIKPASGQSLSITGSWNTPQVDKIN